MLPNSQVFYADLTDPLAFGSRGGCGVSTYTTFHKAAYADTADDFAIPYPKL
jgi:hypothetical protein